MALHLTEIHEPVDPRATTARRTPPWWAVVLVQLAGLGGAATAGIYSALTLPPTGLFGVTNDAGTRWSGFAAAVGAAICLLAGPLFVGLVRKDRRWLGGSAAVVGLLSLTALATLTGG